MDRTAARSGSRRLGVGTGPGHAGLYMEDKVVGAA